jgi:hypothetical protein
MNGMDPHVMPFWGGLRGLTVTVCCAVRQGNWGLFVMSTTVHWLSENGICGFQNLGATWGFLGSEELHATP